MSKNPCMMECRFCHALNKRKAGNSNLPAHDQVLFESQNFVIMPTVGALIEGWLLIISKTHYLSMGQVPPYLHNELLSLKKRVSTILQSVYVKPTIFEHGPSVEGSNVGCGVDHAHLHMVPIDFTLSNKDLSQKGFRAPHWEKTPTDLSLQIEYSSKDRPYFYLEEPTGNGQISSAEDSPSQYFRRLIALQMGMYDRFDYNEHAFEDNISETIKKLGPVFSDLKLESQLKEKEVTINVLESV